MVGESRTVALLFSDIAGSTEKWARFGSAMSKALERHDQIASSVFADYGAIASKHTGDGSLAAFESVSSALDAAVHLQRSMEAADWDIEEPLRLRVGLHLGDAQLRDGDVFGTAVNRVARLMDVAQPGQILVSSVLNSAAIDGVDAYQSIEIGSVNLRGLAEAEVVFQVVAEGLEREFPVPREAVVASESLPVVANEFVGRQQDLAAVARSLSEHRLVTITGPSGVGKTRVAVEVAMSLGSSIGEIWFADLSKARDAEVVETAIRAGLGIPDQPGAGPLDVATEFLASRHGLLIVDNCEHVAPAAVSAIEAILRRASDVTVLATSQARLDMPEETVWPLQPLFVGDDFADAVRLFETRAEAVNPRLDVATEMDSVAALCRDLDGMPLALELAASRCSAMTPSQIHERMQDRFRLLGRHGAEGRHASLQAAVQWSYELLDEEEAALFRTLAVFPAGFTLPMAEQMSGSGGVAEVLASLVDKSLIGIEPGPSPRYRYFATLRSFALEEASDDEQLASAAALADWAVASADRFRVSETAIYDKEMPNLEAAVDHMLRTGDLERSLVVLRTFFAPLVDHHATWERLFERLLALAEEPQLRMRVAAEVSWSYWLSNRFEDMQKAIRISLRSAEEAGQQPPVIALATATLAAATEYDETVAREYASRAREAALTTGNVWDEFMASMSSAWAELAGDDFEAAAVAAERMRAAAAREPDRWAGTDLNVALVYRRVDPARGLQHAQLAVQEANTAGQSWWLGAADGQRGFAYLRMREFSKAAGSFIEGIPHLVVAGDWRLACISVESIAGLVERVGLLREASVLVVGASREREFRGTVIGTRPDVEYRKALEGRLRQELGPEFELAAAEGSALEPGEVFERAVALGRKILDEGLLSNE